VKAGSTKEIVFGAIRLGKFERQYQFSVYKQGSEKEIGVLRNDTNSRVGGAFLAFADTYVLREEWG